MKNDVYAKTAAAYVALEETIEKGKPDPEALLSVDPNGWIKVEHLDHPGEAFWVYPEEKQWARLLPHADELED